MAIYHCSAKTYSRSKGQNAVAHASYISGTKNECFETGRKFNYSRKENVLHSEIVLCDNAPAELADREVLWNAVHSVEKDANSQLAREFEYALPNELPFEENLKLAREIAEWFRAKGMCVDFAIHDPDKEPKNIHCHNMVTTRGFDKSGKWDIKEQKVYANDRNAEGKPIFNPNKPSDAEHRIPVIDPETGNQKVGARGRKMWERVRVTNKQWNNKEFIGEARKMIEVKINGALERNGFDERVSCESLKKQGIDREPTIHEGWKARKMEERGESAERCQINRETALRNAQKAEIRAQIRKLEESKEGLLEQPEEPKKEREEPKKTLFHINTPEERAELLAKRREEDFEKAVNREAERRWRKNLDYYAYNGISFFDVRLDVEEELAPKYGIKVYRVPESEYKQGSKPKPRAVISPEPTSEKKEPARAQDNIPAEPDQDKTARAELLRKSQDKTIAKKPKIPEKLTFKGGRHGRGFYDKNGAYWGDKSCLEELRNAGVKINDPYNLLKKEKG